MFFVLSKVLLIFILPFSWVVFFLMLALITKNPLRKRRFYIISGILLLLFSNPFLFNRIASSWDIKPVPLTKPQYSCAIVLGGFSSVDSKGEGYFNSVSDRFIQGLRLFKTGKVKYLMISGGNGQLNPTSFTESSWTRSQLLQMGVPDSCILIETKSRNTLENAHYSKPILAAKHLQPPYLLVTSAFHMRRSMGIFKKEKLDVIPYPCNKMLDDDTRFSLNEFIPDADPLYRWNYYIKEMVGTLVNFIKNIF